MRVRVIGISMVPEGLDELVNTYQTSILPELREQQGFSSLLLLCGSETGKVLELTLFEDEDAIQKSEEDGGMLDRKLDTLTRGFDVVPDVENYDLTILS
jgi:hypothetical protein